ncbi:hypothetical protein [Xanthomonas campestris]|uniref:hypothetical protein n=2 Tax=Xanthomonas campestris TaxID=339 RepID=UPI00216209B4|nr:hypothetical protein [Xanthomonas campestris]
MPGELPAASSVIPCGATQRRIPRASRVLPVAYDGDFPSDPFQLMTAPVALLCNSRWRDSANTRRSLVTGHSACHRALQQIFNNPTGPAKSAALEPAAQLQQRRGCKRYQARVENTPPKRAENRPHNRCRRDHADTCASALPTRPGYRSLIGETRSGASRNPRAQRYVQTVALLHDAHDNGAIAAIDCAVVALLNSACRQEKVRSNARDGGGAGA